MNRFIDLQLFAEPAAPAVDSSVPATPPQEVTPVAEKPTLASIYERDSQVITPVVESVVQAPVVDTLPPPEKILGKYESLPDLIKAFQSSQTQMNKEHMSLLEVNKVLEQERTAKTELEAKIRELTKPSESVIETDEFAGLDSEALLAKIYEDPEKVLSKFEDRAFARSEKAFAEKLSQIESRLAPVIQRDEQVQVLQYWDDSVKTFQTDKPDMAKFIPEMKQYIADNNLANSKNPGKVLEDAYHYARSQHYPETQPVDPKSYLNDETFVKENILNNPTIKDQIVKEYLAGVRGGQQQVPIGISGQSNGGTVSMPPLARPKTISEATRMAADRIFGAK